MVIIGIFLIYQLESTTQQTIITMTPKLSDSDKKLDTSHELGLIPNTFGPSNLGHNLTIPYHSGNPSSDQFFYMGGRSFMLILPYEQIINVTLGSTVEVPLNVTHIASIHPFDRIKLHYVGIMTHFVPFRDPSHELDLNSTVTAVIPSEITVPAGKSTTVILKMTIPKDWLSFYVKDGMIPYVVRFTDSEQHNFTDVLIPETAFAIRITG